MGRKVNAQLLRGIVYIIYVIIGGYHYINTRFLVESPLCWYGGGGGITVNAPSTGEDYLFMYIGDPRHHYTYTLYVYV